MIKPIINNNCTVLVAVDNNRNIDHTAGALIRSINHESLRKGIAQLCDITLDEVHIDSSACSFALFVFAPNAMRLVEDLNAKDLLKLSQQFCFREPQSAIVGGDFVLQEKHARTWRRLMTTNIVVTSESVSPVIKPYPDGRIVLYFVDKRIASRAINRCFRLTPPCVTPNEITIDGTQYTFECNWGKQTPNSSTAVSSQSRTAPPPPPTHLWKEEKSLVRAVAPSSQCEQPRAFVFHDAENCCLLPSSDGAAMFTNVVQLIKQGLSMLPDDGLLVTWNFVLKSSGVHSSHFRPSARAIEDLRDLGVTMVDPGNKESAVDTTIKSMLRLFLAIWRALTPKAQENTVVVLISGDRDFAHELRELAEAGVRVMLLSGHNVRPVMSQLAWKHSSGWSQMITA